METTNPAESVDRNPYTQERLATQFIQLIEKQKIQYKDIAEKLGFHYTYVSYIQNSRYYDRVPYHVWRRIRNYLSLNTEPADLKSNAVLAGTVSAGSGHDGDQEKDPLSKDEFLSVPPPLENMDIVLRKKGTDKKSEPDDKGVDININLTITVGRKNIHYKKTFRV